MSKPTEPSRIPQPRPRPIVGNVPDIDPETPVQSMMALAVVGLLLGLRPAAIWWALLLLNCSLVLAAELFNTALEHALDHLHPELHPAIKVSKDCAAGAVLIFSFSAVLTFLAFLWSTLVKSS